MPAQPFSLRKTGGDGTIDAATEGAPEPKNEIPMTMDGQEMWVCCTCGSCNIAEGHSSNFCPICGHGRCSHCVDA